MRQKEHIPGVTLGGKTEWPWKRRKDGRYPKEG